MPALANHRWEKYALGLANGFTQAQAYADAGFQPSPANASTLAKNPQVRERVMELVEEMEKRKGVTSPIPTLPTNPNGSLTPEAAGITEEWLVNQLMNNVQQAQLNGKFREANTAIEMLGNYFGGLFDKKNPVDQTQKNKDKDGAGDKKTNLMDLATKLTEAMDKPDKEDDE